MPRQFKSGDWVLVKEKLTAPKMEVIRYLPKKDAFFDLVDYDTYLECFWYKNGERKCEVYQQNKLIKAVNLGGLRRTSLFPPKLSLT